MKITIALDSGRFFSADTRQSILSAAFEGGIALAYSCRTGRCGACKCRVISGNTSELGHEVGLTDSEKAAGWILSCVRSAKSDLLLEAEEISSIKIPPPKIYPCRIVEIKHVGRSVVKVFLKIPPRSDFNYIPGQYIDVISGSGERRSYSLADFDYSSKTMELHIRAVAGGVMSDYWFKFAKPGDLLRFNGPLGTFFLRESAELDLVFLATGTGIAPIKAMIESASALPESQRPSSTTVIWGVRHPGDFYLMTSDIKGDYQFIASISRSNQNWSGAVGYVQDILIRMNLNLQKVAVYACGSSAMIRSSKDLLIKEGLSGRRFYSDAFVSSGVSAVI